MKSKTFTQFAATIVIGLASVAAQAGTNAVTDANYPGPFPTASAKTYADVQAELAQSRAAGRTFNDANYPGDFSTAGVGKTRAQVQQELAAYKASGEQYNDASYPAATPSMAYSYTSDQSRYAHSGKADRIIR